MKRILALILVGLVLTACGSTGGAAGTTTTTSTDTKSGSTSSTPATSSTTTSTSTESVHPAMSQSGFVVMFQPAPGSTVSGIHSWAAAISAAEGTAAGADIAVDVWAVADDVEVLFPGSPAGAKIDAVTRAIGSTGIGGRAAQQLELTRYTVISGLSSGLGMPTTGESGILAEAPIRPSISVSDFGAAVTQRLASQGYHQVIVLLLTGAGGMRQLEVVAIGTPTEAGSLYLASAVAARASVPLVQVSRELIAVE